LRVLSSVAAIGCYLTKLVFTEESAIGMLENSDHALIVHVWHLDTLDELSGYVAYFTPDADRYVTYPDSFSPEIRQTIAEKLPGAFYVPVKNQGQDVGALFQLMDQVDLGRYDFVCKIHTKKGRGMPADWRRALLRGVLSSPEQVGYIIKAFREDSNVQLAGARQLFLHGSMNLGNNISEIEKTFAGLIKDFDFRKQDWGFIAGTCFWIRTSALLDIWGCSITFEPSESYVPDGTPAHAAERMFGMCAALRDGKVLLHDLRFPDRMPNIGPSLPDNLPEGDWQLILRSLTSLVGGAYPIPNYSLAPQLSQPEPKLAATNRKRVAVFVSYSGDGLLKPQVLPYLAGLKDVTEAIVVVCANDLAAGEREKLTNFSDYIISGRHGEYGLAGYRCGIANARSHGLLDDASDLILCDDSCYGPVDSFVPMINKMEARELDFWGATDSLKNEHHVQSYWMVLSRKVFSSELFRNIMHTVKKKENTLSSAVKDEVNLTKNLVQAGFKAGAFVENTLKGAHPKDQSYNDLTLFPIYTLQLGLPLIKVCALHSAELNSDGQNRLLVWLAKYAPDFYKLILSDIKIRRFEDADAEAFSLIMPTRNRAWCISQAIISVMAQTHRHFELIIVDDGSTDGTEELVTRDFSEELAAGRIKYIKLPENVGVCKARNIGLLHARNNWIAYADSDNTIRPYYLTMVANAIVENRDYDAFYGLLINIGAGSIVGGEFDRNKLLSSNFIDLGIFVHRKSLVARFGGFDPDLKRLVDWDLIIRYTSHKPPKFIPRIFLNYSDEDNADRITLKESLSGVFTSVHTKYSVKPTVSTAIICYNHQEFLVAAIESALDQKGNFTHDIMISDDGSTDGSKRIIDYYVRKYPHKIRNISRDGNFGISENYRHCFREAAGSFTAILEGDDYWIDSEKNFKQAEFLTAHPEAAMVFSKIDVFDMGRNTHRLLKRQEGLPPLLTGSDFARNEHLNLIANFSSAMFRTDVMRNMPSAVYLPRLNEIAVSFYMDRIGKIGFLSEVMGIYRQNAASVWTGASRVSQLQQAIAIRENALMIAKPTYKAQIQVHLDEKKAQLAVLESAQTKEKTT